MLTEQNYSNIEIDEDEFKAVDASKIYAETIGKTPPVQAEDVAEEPKDESSIMNGAQSETVSVSDSSESSPEDDNPEMSDMETAKQISAVTNHGGLSVLDIKAMLRESANPLAENAEKYKPIF